jgi:hypothetical protein
MHTTIEHSSINLDELQKGNNGENLSKQNDLDKIFRIVPTAVRDQTLRNMQHIKGTHILKGTIARCEGCKQQFTTLLREPISIRVIITLFRFNEHDYKHRKGCFKKSDDDIFHIQDQ